ncbi:hypothetical protein DEM27_32085 [Metarhizobium album]|uniref:Diguanylate phosphodiesterase n=1 Tax=Metarhizobium album TaxID=2182425 RepID=A0A2U2DG00_9HYPH|nr:EAL domain-containing response regulator [Rhizobium album]PWE52222.1 hypothetical protein DEM27_32085 [Rhizobium album]
MKPCLKCLIVDDDEIFRTVAESVLSALIDGEVDSAASGDQGITLMMARSFDLVLLDLNMPDLDGLGFLRLAAEHGFNGQIVISSGEAAATLRSAGLMGEMLGVRIAGSLRKPLQLSEVKELLAKLERREETATIKPDEVFSRDFCTLQAYYQPQFNVRTGAMEGVEALIRLRAESGRIYGPNRVFDAIASTDELARVSLEIMDIVLDDISRWQNQGHDIQTSINFDSSVLELPGMAGQITERVKSAGIASEKICLELTERSLPTDLSYLVEALARLRIAGFKLSLDDYGTGASNFELLRLCPFSELKFDRKIIEACPSDAVVVKFLENSAQIARDLGLATVAEGVETEAELNAVRNARIDLVQGYLFSRPVPSSNILEFVTSPPIPHQAQAAR